MEMNCENGIQKCSKNLLLRNIVNGSIVTRIYGTELKIVHNESSNYSTPSKLYHLIGKQVIFAGFYDCLRKY